MWVDLWSGSVLFDDVSTLVFPRKRAFFPITPDSWIRPLGDEFGELVLTPKKTAEVVARRGVLGQPRRSSTARCASASSSTRSSPTSTSTSASQAKAQHKEAAEEAAYDAIGAVMRSESDTPRELLDSVGAEPVLKACALVGHAARHRGPRASRRDRGSALRGAGRGGRRRRPASAPASSRCATTGGTTTTGRCSARSLRRAPRSRCCRRGFERYDYINPKSGERSKVDARVGEAADAVRLHVLPAVPGRRADGPRGHRLRRARPRRRHQVAALHRHCHRHVRLGDAVPHRQDLRRGDAAGRPRHADRLRRRADAVGARHRRSSSSSRA